MDELVSWLRDRIRTRRLVAHDALLDWPAGPDGDEIAGEVASILVGAHLAFNDPQAVLAMCDSQTALIEYALEPDDKGDQDERLIRLLALGYQHCDGYQDQWRP